MKYVFGNWKANLSQTEVTQWTTEFKELYRPSDSVTVGIFPSYLHLTYVAKALGDLANLVIGAQSASPYQHNVGQTGTVVVPNLVGIVDYLLIAHSEFRMMTTYTHYDFFTTYREAINDKIAPIYCIRGKEDPFPEDVRFIAYEPVEAIGTGKNKAIEDVRLIKNTLKLPKSCAFIYGGSVNKNNCNQYAQEESVDGVLVGTASLSPQEFNSIICAFQPQP